MYDICEYTKEQDIHCTSETFQDSFKDKIVEVVHNIPDSASPHVLRESRVILLDTVTTIVDPTS